jgi:hypothetical protein
MRAALLGTVTRLPRGRRLIGERLIGIGIAYPHQRGEDWMVGRRMPDIVHAVDAHPELPDAVLVRPDSYVALASERLPDSAEVAAAVDRWTRVT